MCTRTCSLPSLSNTIVHFLFQTSPASIPLLALTDRLLFFFFFQAEDGIRDLIVTGVQTCALPIYGRDHGRGAEVAAGSPRGPAPARRPAGLGDEALPTPELGPHPDRGDRSADRRAEPGGRDRRVLPPGRAERGGRRVPALPRLQEREEPGRGARPLGARRRPLDAPLLSDGRGPHGSPGGRDRLVHPRPPAPQSPRARPHPHAARDLRGARRRSHHAHRHRHRPGPRVHGGGGAGPPPPPPPPPP